jgi:hypothetical protein
MYNRNIEITSFNYQDSEDGFYYKLKNYFTPSQIGNRAQVKFRVLYVSKNGDTTFEENYIVNIKFFFRPIKKINNEFTKIKFFIEGYNLEKIEN